MSVAVSPLPSPLFPWHISQSSVHHLLARANDSGVAFTGFGTLVASTGIAEYEGVFCAAAEGEEGCWLITGIVKTSKSAGRTSANLYTGTSLLRGMASIQMLATG